MPKKRKSKKQAEIPEEEIPSLFKARIEIHVVLLLLSHVTEDTEEITVAEVVHRLRGAEMMIEAASNHIERFVHQVDAGMREEASVVAPKRKRRG